jgi:hypothetical protein
MLISSQILIWQGIDVKEAELSGSSYLNSNNLMLFQGIFM